MLKFYDSVENFFKWILVISLAAMAILNFANVLSRYVLHASLSFTEEITTNIFVFNTFIGAAMGARRGAHLGLSIISDRVNAKTRKSMLFSMNLISAGLFAILIYLGYGMVKSQFKFGQTTAALGLPEWWFGMAIPIGAFFIMFSFLVAGIEILGKEEI
ncbi:MAG: TRAP transporter small permease [Clostridiales bacterium]|nr:TRAP transporter small permease [Clostridiales bacterium]